MSERPLGSNLDFLVTSYVATVRRRARWASAQDGSSRAAPAALAGDVRDRTGVTPLGSQVAAPRDVAT